eukprot:4925839-Prymnesium_polylepis.1
MPLLGGVQERKDLQVQALQYYTMLQKAKPTLETQDRFCMGFAITDKKEGKGGEGDSKEAKGRAADGKGDGDGDGKGDEAEGEGRDAKVKEEGGRKGSAGVKKERSLEADGQEPPAKAQKTSEG